MGGQQSKSDEKYITTFDGSWSKVGEHRNGVNYRNQDGRFGSLYNYILQNNYDPQNQQTMLEQRARTSLPLVQPYTCDIKNNGGFLKPENNFSVMTQGIKLLTDSPQLSFPEILYTLSQSLKGYEYLYQKVGPFYINSDMLGFNNQGKLKVWLNENFGNNHPSHPQNILMSTVADKAFDQANSRIIRNEQATMVRNICNVVEDKCQQGRFPITFGNQIHQSGIGFLQATKIIQNTIVKQSIMMPNSVDLAKNLILIRSPRMTLNRNPYPQVFPRMEQTVNYRVFPK